MQTFLPYPSFIESAKCLDMRRLNKQRSEAKTLIQLIEQGPYAKTTLSIGGELTVAGERTPWWNHPAAAMWRNYVGTLKHYHNAIIMEWMARGYKNNMPLMDVDIDTPMPHWTGDYRLYDSHRSNLLRKEPLYYARFDWNVPDDLPYYWPGE